jgi:hypothetical protein
MLWMSSLDLSVLLSGCAIPIGRARSRPSPPLPSLQPFPSHVTPPPRRVCETTLCYGKCLPARTYLTHSAIFPARQCRVRRGTACRLPCSYQYHVAASTFLAIQCQTTDRLKQQGFVFESPDIRLG